MFIPIRPKKDSNEDKQLSNEPSSKRQNFIPKVETVSPEAKKLFEEMKEKRRREIRQARER